MIWNNAQMMSTALQMKKTMTMLNLDKYWMLQRKRTQKATELHDASLHEIQKHNDIIDDHKNASKNNKQN